MNTPVSLLERLRRPDEQEAWVRFVELYTPLLFGWARRLGLRDADAADLVQEVFAVLVAHMRDFHYDRTRSFRAWLHTVLHNKWRNRCRRRPEVSLDPAGPDLARRAAPPAPCGLEETEYRQHLVARALRLMQAEFAPSSWKACWEYVVRGRPAAEVASELGLTINAVYLAKCRVLRRLREELEGLLD